MDEQNPLGVTCEVPRIHQFLSGLRYGPPLRAGGPSRKKLIMGEHPFGRPSYLINTKKKGFKWKRGTRGPKYWSPEEKDENGKNQYLRTGSCTAEGGQGGNEPDAGRGCG